MVMTKPEWIAAICLSSCFLCSLAFGCVYTVRDIGFVDVSSTPYYLYYYIRDDTPEDLTSTFKQISYNILMDSNVEIEIVNADQEGTHPAMKYLRFWEVESLPAVILVSPERQSRVLPISVSYERFKEKIQPTLENVLSSPKREEILQHIVKAYCVVLLIQGKDAAENKRAEGAVADAIRKIDKIMDQMFKPADEPPRPIVISPESFSEEKILLWSLGVNESEVSKPYVAVLYGRGRRIGSLLKGERITTDSLFNILSVIGLDCECGLDRELMLGTMIPLKWGRKVQSKVMRLLSFDAESPMVKTRVSQILSMGYSLSAAGRANEYRERVIEFESSSTVPTVSLTQSHGLHGLASGDPASSRTSSTFLMILLIMGGMILLILAGGAFIILRARKGTS